MRNSKSLRLAAVSALALAGFAPVGGYAQEVDQPEVADPSDSQVGDIVVTASRLGASGFDAPTPVSVIGAEEIDRAAPPTISDFVNQLPALSGSNSPRTTKAAIGNGLAGGNFLNLRNLGVSRTLVLQDGRRVTPSTLTGAVDANMIPSALVERVDVVTGGASAAWGSDAVAGVINFVLDRDFTGIKGNVQAGITTEGDGENYTADLSFGTPFADGAGHFLISGRYSKMEEAFFRDRDWFKAYSFVPNPAFGAAGESQFLSAPWASIHANDTGLIATGPLAGYYFDAQGNLAGTDFPLDGKSSIYIYGDEAVYNRLADQAQNNQASIPMEQYSVFSRASYDVSDSISVYVEGTYAKMESSALVANYWRVGNTSVSVDNYYLPDEVRAAMIDAGLDTLPLSIANTKMGIINNRTMRENYSGVLGLEGAIGANWDWNAYYQYGKSKSKTRAEGMPIPSAYAAAIDAVEDPANPGQPICRSSITDPTNGCLPFNPFGSQPLSAAQLANVVGVSAWDVDYTQQVASLNLSGDLFDLPAGPIRAALGAEYRKEKAVADADARSEINGFWAGNFKDFDGNYNVKEAYLELGVPVFVDSALGNSFDLNLAGRLTDYSTSGSVFTWKAGFRYEIADWVELRFTRSRDIRAPNLQDLFQPGLVGNQAIYDPFIGADTRMTQTLSGNLELDPEKADTLTAGVILNPSFAPGLKFSIDYYDIKIKEAIATNSSQFIVNRCFEGVDRFCDAITFAADGSVSAVNLKPFNALAENARGIDFEFSYRTDVGAGDLDLRVLANYIDKLEIVSPDTVISRAGEVGNNNGAAEGAPAWKALASATYSIDPLTFQLKSRFIGASKQDRQWTDMIIDRNNVPAIIYFDAFVGYDVTMGSMDGQFYLAADNVLDKGPPIVTPNDTANSVNPGTNQFIYDTLGRTIRAGFRFEF